MTTDRHRIIKKYWKEHRWKTGLSIERPIWYIEVLPSWIDPNPSSEFKKPDLLKFELHVETNYRERFRVYKVVCEDLLVHAKIEEFE